MGLDRALVERIGAMGTADVPIKVLTKVQKHVFQCDPERNLYAIAATGSGKTLAFLAPILRDMSRGKCDGALLLSPTNPLRLQHIRTAEAIAPPIASVVKIESRAAARTLLESKGPALSISTPAKWLAIMDTRPGNARSYAANRLSVIVLDEVDEMVRNPGFLREIKQVIASSPSARLVAMTATHSPQALDFVREVSDRSKRGLTHIDAGDPQENGAAVHRHTVTSVDASQILPTLVEVLRDELAGGHKILVFCATAYFAEFAHAYASARGLRDVHVLHSKMNRGAASKAESTFRRCASCAMVCSNVLARGMDIPDVDVVVQLGSSKAEIYAQRVGRSGRAGRAGRGALIVAREEEAPMVAALSEKGISLTEVPPPASKKHAEKDARPIRDRDLQRSGHRAFKSLLGAYKSELHVLGWSMRDAVGVVKSMFAGVGVAAPSIPAKNKIGIKQGDGLILSGGGSRATKTSLDRYASMAACLSITAVLALMPDI